MKAVKANSKFQGLLSASLVTDENENRYKLSSFDLKSIEASRRGEIESYKFSFSSACQL